MLGLYEKFACLRQTSLIHHAGHVLSSASVYGVGHQATCRAFYAVGLEAQGSYKDIGIQVKHIKFVQGTNYHAGAINEFRGESQSPEEQRKAKTKGKKNLRWTEPRSKRLNNDKVKTGFFIDCTWKSMRL